MFCLAIVTHTHTAIKHSSALTTAGRHTPSEGEQNICLINLLSHETRHSNNRLIPTFLLFFLMPQINKIALHFYNALTCLREPNFLFG